MRLSLCDCTACIHAHTYSKSHKHMNTFAVSLSLSLSHTHTHTHTCTCTIKCVHQCTHSKAELHGITSVLVNLGTKCSPYIIPAWPLHTGALSCWHKQWVVQSAKSNQMELLFLIKGSNHGATIWLMLTRTASAQMTHIQVQNYQNHVGHVSSTNTSHTKPNVLDLLSVCSSHAPQNYSEQESKNNLQLMILTYLWP